MYYVTDENENRVDLETVISSLITTKSISAVGMTLILDGIECYGIYGTITELSYMGNAWYAGSGDAIFVDKNHDLSYYANSSDWVDSSDYNQSPGTFGYEWGGHGAETGVAVTVIGFGLSSTNSLIEMNLQPRTDGWYVVWDKIKEFRQSHSDQWFLPNKGELNLIYEARANLNNLSLNTRPYYWSSSERDSTNAWCQSFADGSQLINFKSPHNIRSRLCRQY